MLTWVRCKLSMHKWEHRTTEDGKRYETCRNCGAIKNVAETSVPPSTYM